MQRMQENRGKSIEAGLQVRLALCGLEGLTPMGRKFWAWKASQLWRRSPAEQYPQ